jgi:hypothetical protein
MAAPAHPWYQFSLRSLLLFTLFVAVMCSLGVCTSWLVSAAIAMTVMIGGVAGRIVAGIRAGFMRGILSAIPFGLLAVHISLLLVRAFPQKLYHERWLLSVPLGIAALIGGVLGGLSIRPRSGR